MIHLVYPYCTDKFDEISVGHYLELEFLKKYSYGPNWIVLGFVILA